MIDWTPLVQASIAGAAGIVSAASAVAAAYIVAHQRNKTAAALEAKAVKLAGGVAYDSLMSAVANGAPNWAAAKATAIREGQAAGAELVPSISVNSVIAGLAPLMAVDPTAPAGTGSAATATTAPGGSAAAIAETAKAV